VFLHRGLLRHRRGDQPLDASADGNIL